MKKRSAIIAGATGLIGRILLKELLDQDYYGAVMILTRRELDMKHPHLVQVVVEDFDRLHEIEELLTVDDVYCCLGTTIKTAGSKEAFKKVDYSLPLEIAKITRKNGAGRYLVVTALGASEDSRIFYNRVKGELERDLQKIDFPSICIFRPSLLLGEREDDRKAEKAAQSASQFFSFAMVGPLKKYKPIEASEVAKGMIHLAKRQPHGVEIVESKNISFLANAEVE